ncbi:MAG: endonuclease III [Bacteroidetes bacterium]|nr:MAG: endonuclease III [Bacteroidota bacterium]
MKRIAQRTETDWNAALAPLRRKYGRKKHPLEFRNEYQLIVMTVLSARASDAMVNKLAPAFFLRYPSFTRLASATPEELYPLLRVPGFRNKAAWIIDIAKTLAGRKRLPETMDELVTLKGFGRKSANVFMSQTGLPAAGVIVDLHTVRVAPRLGIAEHGPPERIERRLMERIDRKHWHAAGMALTFLGREICRPTKPKCHECPLSGVCAYARSAAPAE